MKKTAIAMIFMALTSVAGGSALADEPRDVENTSYDYTTSESLTGVYNYENGTLSFKKCPFRNNEIAAANGYKVIEPEEIWDPVTREWGRLPSFGNSCVVVPNVPK